MIGVVAWNGWTFLKFLEAGSAGGWLVVFVPAGGGREDQCDAREPAGVQETEFKFKIISGS